MIHSHQRNILGSPLARRLLRDLALFGVVAIMVLTAIRLYYAYHQLRGELETQLNEVQTAHVTSLAQSLWTTNETEVALQLQGIVAIPFLEYAAVLDSGNAVSEAGRRISANTIERHYSLTHEQLGQTHGLGTLIVAASLDAVYLCIREEAVIILFSNAAAIFALALVMFIVFYREVTRHLLATSNYLRQFDIEQPVAALKLARRTPAQPDELDELVAALNTMQINTREALNRLNESEERFRFALQGANDGLWDWDIKTNRVFYSSRWKSMLGYAENELENVFATWERLVHPQDLPGAVTVLQEYFDKRRDKYEAEFRMRHKDGHWVHILARGTATRGDTGEPLRMAGTHVDISERIATNQLIVRERVRLKAILKTASDGIHILDRDGTLVEASASFLNMLGYDETALGHLKVTDWDALFPADGIHRGIRELLAGGLTRTIETRHRHRDGQIFDVEISLRGFTIDGQQLLYASSRDITARKIAEREREQMQIQLRHAQKMETIGQLTGGIAHDFNNILASILGYTGLAQDRYGDAVPDKVKIYLAEVQHAGERGRDLVAKMLAFARSKKDTTQVVALTPLVTSVVNMLSEILPAGIRLQLRDENNAELIRTDPVMLQDAITNLIINARDALGDQGSINLVVKKRAAHWLPCASCHAAFSGDFLELSITDTGSGIVAETLPRIFDPFFTTKEKGKGTGLGLAMVHGVVHDAGGHIQVESAPGAGTTFRLFLPIATAAAQFQPAPTRGAEVIPRSKTSKLILVVDDEEAIAQYETELLGIHGYRARMFTDPRAALEAYRAAPDTFAAMITDHTMPGLSGAELARAVMEITPDLPIILCTGYSENIDARSAAHIGIKRFFDKPVRSADLMTALGELM